MTAPGADPAPEAALPPPAQPRLLAVGDTGISVEFSREITLAANEAVAALDTAVTAADIPGVVETVPTYRSLLVIYEPALTDRKSLLTRLRAVLATAPSRAALPGRQWSIPVVYEDGYGEDLPELSGLLGVPPRAIVAAHTAATFRVYMLGFQPGLPNLGGLPPELQVSRRTTPRQPVPGGSVMIGGVQGAIMPYPTPSGFYLLGRTPVRLFDRRRPEPALFRTGDTIRFREIGTDEFTALADRVAGGDLQAGADMLAQAA